MSRLIDLTGERFGRLIVIKRVENDKWGHHQWLCKCDCRNKPTIRGNDLRIGRTRSCGCLNKEVHTTHGQTRNKNKTGLYQSWQDMKHRCINPNFRQWKDYGGRGIIVCLRWMEFENFNKDMGESWEPGLTLERRNNDKGYYLENCYWGTRKEQSRNTRRNHLIEFNRKTQCIIEWSEETGIPAKIIRWRLKYGWSTEKSLTTPVGKYSKRSK